MCESPLGYRSTLLERLRIALRRHLFLSLSLRHVEEVFAACLTTHLCTLARPTAPVLRKRRPESAAAIRSATLADCQTVRSRCAPRGLGG